MSDLETPEADMIRDQGSVDAARATLRPEESRPGLDPDNPGAAPDTTRWGRSTTDLLATLKESEARRVSVVALNGMTFDPATPHGRMLATMLAGIAEFERELIQERIRSGIAAEGARQEPGPPAWTTAEI